MGVIRALADRSHGLRLGENCSDRNYKDRRERVAKTSGFAVIGHLFECEEQAALAIKVERVEVDHVVAPF